MAYRKEATITLHVNFDDLIAFNCVCDELAEQRNNPSLQPDDRAAIESWLKRMERFENRIELALEYQE